MRTLLAVCAVAVAVLCGVAAAQSSSGALTALLDGKEAAIRQAAVRASAIYSGRCTASCESCSVPACGNTFAASRGFGCTAGFGSNATLCANAACSATSLVRSFATSTVRFPLAFNNSNAETAAFVCSTAAMDSEFQQRNATLRAWQYIGHAGSGATRVWPGAAQSRQTTGDGMCTDYDARLRPWYVAGSTGPKDIVIVVDKSGSMGNNIDPAAPSRGTRWAAAQTAVRALLDTLTPNDNVGVVTFSSSASTLGGHSALIAATAANVAALKASVSAETPSGVTNFNPGLSNAFSLIRSTPANVSNCNRVVLFVTDGVASESESEVAAFINARQAELVAANTSRAHIFTFAMGSDASATIPAAMACAHRGAFAVIPNSADPLSKMRAYFEFIAGGLTGGAVRWTSPYEDAFGLGEVVTAAMPVVATVGGVPRVVSVVAADILMSELTATGVNRSDALALLASRGRTCTRVNLTECQMQFLRQRSSAGAQVCTSNANTSIANCSARNDVLPASTCNGTGSSVNARLCEALNTTTGTAMNSTTRGDAQVMCGANDTSSSPPPTPTPTPTTAPRWSYRLVGGNATWGLLQARPNPTYAWGTVCDDLFGATDAMIACRSLGLSVGSTYTPTYRTVSGSGELTLSTVPIHLTNLQCQGTEAELAHCSRSSTFPVTSCSRVENVVLNCGSGERAPTLVPYPTPTAAPSVPRVPTSFAWQYRLTGSGYENKGVLEVRPDAQHAWGRVCGDRWGTVGTRVLCASLGQTTVGATFAISTVSGVAFAADEEATLYMAGVECSGSEPRVDQCPRNATLACSRLDRLEISCGVPSMRISSAFRLSAVSGSSAHWAAMLADSSRNPALRAALLQDLRTLLGGRGFYNVAVDSVSASSSGLTVAITFQHASRSYAEDYVASRQAAATAGNVSSLAASEMPLTLAEFRSASGDSSAMLSEAPLSASAVVLVNNAPPGSPPATSGPTGGGGGFGPQATLSNSRPSAVEVPVSDDKCGDNCFAGGFFAVVAGVMFIAGVTAVTLILIKYCRTKPATSTSNNARDVPA